MPFALEPGSVASAKGLTILQGPPWNVSGDLLNGGQVRKLRLVEMRLYPALQRAEVECAALAGNLAAIFKNG